MELTAVVGKISPCLVGRMTETANVLHTVAKLVAHPMAPSGGLQNVLDALVAGEDRRFYRHPGVDPWAIGRAATVWLLRRKVSGASTIEQQLVRTIRERYEVTLARKVSEIAIAVVVSRRFSKRDLALAYLGIAYFGWRGRGIVEAANRHKIDLPHSTTGEAAFLVAMLRYPLPQHPTKARLDKVQRRARYIETLAAQKRQTAGLGS